MMVAYKNEYINLVILGSFNPAILTHAFLVKHCGLDIAKEPKTNTPPVPVFASLEYENISFFIDLGRLQITQKHCEDPKSSRLPFYLAAYIKTLPYTPLTKVGTNFSYQLTVSKERIMTVEGWLTSDRKKLCEILRLPTVDLEVHSKIDANLESLTGWTIRAKVADYKAATTMKVSRISGNDEKIQVDFNYEVGNLEKDANLLKAITEEYSKVVDLFQHQIERIFG